MNPADFESLVLDAFSYLISDYGFIYAETSVHSPECWATFQNARTRVTVHTELGSQPWVVLAEVQRKTGYTVVLREAALEFLIQERAVDEKLLMIDPDNDAQMKRLIYEKARQLREYGTDVLRGDLRVFPRLRELAEENLRKRNATEP